MAAAHAPPAPPPPPGVFRPTSTRHLRAAIRQFQEAPEQMPHINDWDVSAITDMSNLFGTGHFTSITNRFNEPLDRWDTSNVTTMEGTFFGCPYFDQPLSWDTSRVTNMSSMFYGCTLFNQRLLFDTSSVTDMSLMFYGCLRFNQPLPWNTVALEMTIEMFLGCVEFNQPLPWDTSRLLDMHKMFQRCASFNQQLRWDTRRVRSMSKAFHSCTSFNQPVPWNTREVRDMGGMFYECQSFNQPLSFNTRRVLVMALMFYGCSAFNRPLHRWDVRAVDSMLGMFVGCSSFNQPLNDWNTTSVTVMYVMFAGCAQFNQPLDRWNTSSVVSMYGMFRGCTVFNQPLNSWDTSLVETMSSMFRGCAMFNQPLGAWDTSTVDSMIDMFHGCTQFNQCLAGWDMAQMPATADMFLEAPSMLAAHKPAGVEGTGTPFVAAGDGGGAANAIYGAIAFRVHTFFDRIDLPRVMLLLQSDGGGDGGGDGAEEAGEAAAAVASFMPHDILLYLFSFVRDLPEVSARALAMQRLVTLESRILALSLDDEVNEDPSIGCGDLVRLSLEFVHRQPAAFRANYVETFTHDCVTAYDSGVGLSGNVSCLQGVWERLVTSIANGGMGTDVPLYQELASVLQNSVEQEIIQSFTAQCVNGGAEQLRRIAEVDARVAWVKSAVMHKLLAAARVARVHPVLPAVDAFVEAGRSMLSDDFLL